jgi:hypothetical protein
MIFKRSSRAPSSVVAPRKRGKRRAPAHNGAGTISGEAAANIDGQHVLHPGYKGAVGLRRDDPALPVMGFETVFLSVRPMVESLACPKLLTLLIAQSDNVLFYRNLHPSHDCPRRFESWLKRIIQSFQIG